MRIDAALAKLLWRVLALVFLALGVIGVFLPVLPTVPFLIAAAWAGGRGWPALENWLLGHPHFGPHIRNWREAGAVPRRAKVAAISMMSVSAVLLVLIPGVPVPLKAAVLLVMALVGIWLWRRPEP
ncbi:MAG TPA: YbaN family protein [Ramlibacter sp.]